MVRLCQAHGVAIVPHDRQRMDAVELPPFVAAIQAGVRLVMTAHLAYPALDGGANLPATLAPRVLRDLLRDELGFEGVVISDALNMGAITQGPGLVIDALASAAAGVDLLLLGANAASNAAVRSSLVQATERTLLDAADIRRSAERVLALKGWLGAQSQPGLEVVGAVEHLALARRIAARAVTLVRDDTQRLPLRLGDEARVAVVVPRSVDLTPADTSSYVACGLAEAVRNQHRNTDEFAVAADPDRAAIDALLDSVRGYDLVIVGTINATTQTGQAALVQALLDSGAAVVVAALRMPYDLTMFPAAPTYVCSYSILEPATEALAEALWGRSPFAGRLPVSIPGLYPLGHGLISQPVEEEQ